MRVCLFFVSLLLAATAARGQSLEKQATKQATRPHVVVIGVNGMELDVIRPLLLKGAMPNLEHVINNGAYGKLRTVSAPNCPRVYSTIFTSTDPDEHGVTGFLVGGITANTNMLKEEPIWSVLSRNDVTVGMANVPATFPVMPVNGYMISGMLTRGKNCEDGVLCAPKLSDVTGGDAVYPRTLQPELLKNVGDFYIDCERMPGASDLKGREKEVIDKWLDKVQLIRDEQTKLFDYLLTKHPTDFAMLGQSCEDRTGHWLYPIAPYNVGYNASINSVRVEAFPDQYIAFDKVLGSILKHVDDNTYVIILSDHGIKPLREFENKDPHAHMDHEKTTPVIAKHDFADGDDVPGSFFAMGPGIKHNSRLMGFEASVYDITPTILHIYGIEQPKQMRGRVLTEIFDNNQNKALSRSSK
ncbi:MAG TPA: alkaline phosphatase family protein [Methylomirabilota bacterium]|jgi:predicted AlkP superfamily phosphohydrolase/phosphomutase|nr:alkaline phosphatase family protein [Methylomirabilota bacterium]